MMDYAYELPEMELDFMNDDHERVVEICNALVTQFAASKPDFAAITQELQALLQDCRAHFGREDALMLEYRFPPYGCHHKEHERVLQEVDTELTNWQVNHDLIRLNGYIQGIFVPWLVNHVSTMDTVTSQFIKHQGG